MEKRIIEDNAVVGMKEMSFKGIKQRIETGLHDRLLKLIQFEKVEPYD